MSYSTSNKPHQLLGKLIGKLVGKLVGKKVKFNQIFKYSFNHLQGDQHGFR